MRDLPEPERVSQFARLGLSVGSLLLAACMAQETGVEPLIGATASPTHVALSQAQQLAIGRLVVGDATLCTGWAISSRHLVTAGHCFNEQVGAGEVDFIPGGALGGTRLPLARVEKHSSLDVAIVTLGVELDLSSITPLELNREVAEPGWTGQTIEVAGSGFGTSPTVGVGFGTFTLLSVSAWLLTIDGDAARGACRGDSGGPFLKSFGAGTRVVALVSEGAASCEGATWGPRADVFAPWVTQRVAAPLPPPSERCAPNAPSRCEGDVSLSCVAGWWRARECACGWRSESADLGCLPQACGALDGHGACERGVALWCGPGGQERLDCGARGLGCGWSPSAEGFRCQACTACGGQCVDLSRDPEHCGSCGTRCESQQCEEGACVVVDTVEEPTPELPSSGCSTSGAPALAALLLAWKGRSRRNRGTRRR